MPTIFLAILLLVLSLTLSVDAQAQTQTQANEDVWQAKAQQLHLADAPYWRVLLYYEPVDHGYVSRVRNQPAFFLSPTGQHDPAAELSATLHLWLSENGAAANTSVSCHFPARIAWLREQLGITGTDHATASCPDLDAWLTAINPAQATLVFPSAYLNNPSSMFGHTLLRIDTPDQTEATRLLAYAVNYAAQTRETNGLMFAVKGLTGGYPGGYSLLPYYEKVKEYSDLENRDLWEYQLTLTPTEVRRLLLHLWEMRGITFPYYFFSDNCSYELLGLIDAARPGLALQGQFSYYAIPADTVRVVLAEHGMLKAVVYRASAATRLEAEITGNTTMIDSAALSLLKNPQAEIGNLDAASQARATETAYDVLYYRFLASDSPPNDMRLQLRALLLKRSSIDAPDQRPIPVEPAVDPAHGHGSARASLDTGVDGGHDFVGIDLRPAYHDLLDTPGGYVSGAHIDFLDTGLRYLPDTTQLQIDHFTLLAIDSLTPRDAFIKPLSWGMAFGQRREPLDADGHFDAKQRRAVAYGEGETGIGLQTGDALCYAQIKGEVEAAQVIQSGWRSGLGPRLGCLGAAGEHSQWQTELQSLHRDDSNTWTSSALLGWQHQTGGQNALRLNARLDAQGSQRASSVELAWLHYF